MLDADSGTVRIGDRLVGRGQPVFIIAEIGINHNGDLTLLHKLIEAAADAGCDAVKFQKRTPEVCVPADQRDKLRDTPWGRITYLDYRHRVELDRQAYEEIDQHCQVRGIRWLASCWDQPALEFIERFQPDCYKIASALLTHDELLAAHQSCRRPIILSTGMSTLAEIDHAVQILGRRNLIMLHCTSTYPAAHDEINLTAMHTLAERYDVPIGYSGHEAGLAPSLAAAALGAVVIERHITLDRKLWGSDQAASLEPSDFARLVRNVRIIEAALGDGVKRVYESELPARAKLRGSKRPDKSRSAA